MDDDVRKTTSILHILSSPVGPALHIQQFQGMFVHDSCPASDALHCAQASKECLE